MRILLSLLLLITLAFSATAQSRSVSGKVTDAMDGSALPGVNIVVQGTTKGITTDADGNYTISLEPSETTLVFSFIGYVTQSLSVGERTVLDVIMSGDATELSEIVVVGYGEQKKSDITGATASVKGDELFKQPVLTATQAMQGKMAGVQIISSGQPGSSPQIRIRGIGTALAGTTALYVVDGVLTDDISNINTADITDVNVLKDASAAAIYGSRGANGVIIITTKKGPTDGLKINYNNNIGIRQAANLVQMANAAEYSNYVQAATGNAPAQTGYNTDWYNTILRNAWQQSHNLSVAGGTEKATFLLNLGFLDDEGIVVENSFKRFTARVNNEYKFSEHLKFGLQSSFTNSVNQNGFSNIEIDAFGNVGTVYNDAYRAAPIIPDIIDGRYGNTSSYQNVGNPLLDVRNNSVRVQENRWQGSSFVEVKPVSWLALRSSIGADSRNSLNRGYYYQFNPDETTFITAGGNQYNTLSNLNIKNIQSFRWVWDNMATFTKSFDKHDFTLLVGTTAEKYHRTTVGAYRKDIPANEDLWYISVGNANTSQNSGDGDAWSRNSYLARLNYSYNDKYLLTASYRSDGSSRLPRQNRWQQYPSLGVAWVLSREGFMDTQDVFDMLKVRASYGKVGNDQVPTNAYSVNVAQNKDYPFTGMSQETTTGNQINQIIDPNIKWETTREYDLAVEFTALRARLSGEVNVYDKKVENALVLVPIPRTVGDADGVIITNVASIQNRGLEIVLNWKDRINDNLSYSIGANATLNQNKVVALNGGQAVRGGGIGAAQGFTTFTDNGQPIGSFYVLKVLGVFNTGAEVAAYQNADGKVIQPTAKPGDFKYFDKNGDGQIDDNDRDYAGSYQPKAYFGLNLGLNFKNWDFNMSIYGNVGNQVYNGKKAVRVSGLDNVEKDVVYKRWTAANRSQTEPGANTGNQLASDYFVESGAFARINNLTIGYTFPKSFLEKARISSLRLFATSQNLFTYKKYSGFTAELPGDPVSSGIELSSYPTTRTIAAGLNVGF